MIFTIKRKQIYTIIIILYLIILLNLDHTHFNGITKKNDTLFCDKLLNRIYFITTTLSTIGYGDISPKTRILKCIAISLQIIIIYALVDLVYNKIN